MKTIAEWLSELPHPISRIALYHHSTYRRGSADSLANALVLGFRWTITVEGSEFWKNIHSKVLDGSIFNYKVIVEKPIKVKVVKVKPIKIKKRKLIKVKKIKVKPIEYTSSYYGQVYDNIDDAIWCIYNKQY